MFPRAPRAGCTTVMVAGVVVVASSVVAQGWHRAGANRFHRDAAVSRSEVANLSGEGLSCRRFIAECFIQRDTTTRLAVCERSIRSSIYVQNFWMC